MPKGVPAVKKEPAPAELAPHELLFLQSIRDFFPSLRLHSDKLLTSKIGYDKLQDHALELHAFITSGAGELRRNEYLALANQIFRCLSNQLDFMHVPTTLNTLLNNIGMIEHAVNEAFPWYQRSKLLKYLIQFTKPIQLDEVKQVEKALDGEFGV